MKKKIAALLILSLVLTGCTATTDVSTNTNNNADTTSSATTDTNSSATTN